jgi:uncharacterized spore protein YtfJ
MVSLDIMESEGIVHEKVKISEVLILPIVKVTVGQTLFG